MLTLKSFTFDQEAEMNEVLRKGRLAAGSHVFVSDGNIIIPIEDGEPKNNDQKIIDCKEQKNTVLDQRDIIIHSQKVLERLIKDAKPRVEEAEADLAEAKARKKEKGKEKFADITELEKRVEGARSALNQLEVQKLQNAMELARLTLNVELFDERIAELSA